jgi:hypothetical protein
MRRISSVGSTVPGPRRATAFGRETVTALAGDPSEAIESAIAILEGFGDVEAAVELIYLAIESEGIARSGAVNPLHLQSAALRLARGDVAAGRTYLDRALGVDEHAPIHDPQVVGVPSPTEVFMPSWPLTLLVGSVVGGTVIGLAHRMRRAMSVGR